jgi:hypothetical protein
VKDDFNAFDSFRDSLGIGDATLDEVDLGTDRRQVGLAPGAEIVKDDNLVAGLEQSFRQVGTNEASSSGDQHFPHGSILQKKQHRDVTSRCRRVAITLDVMSEESLPSRIAL